MLRHLTLLGAFAFILAVPAQAQWVDPPASVADEDPSGEGIQVHGRWTITVRNPDGSLAQTTTFENALVTEGARALAELLAGDFEIDRWNVFVAEPLCSSPGGTPAFCYSTTRKLGTAGPNAFETLETSVEDIDGVPTFILNGEVETSRSGQITEVSTRVDSANDGTRSFTVKVLDTPVDVAAGQDVQVRVEITFE